MRIFAGLIAKKVPVEAREIKQTGEEVLQRLVEVAKNSWVKTEKGTGK
jgi:hypothetical protein